jgi:uncharacterized membrane protein
MAHNNIGINLVLAFLVIMLLANLRINTWIKIALMPILSIIAGLVSSLLLYPQEPGSFAVMISSSFIVFIFVACLYAMTRKFFQTKAMKAEEKEKLKNNQ